MRVGLGADDARAVAPADGLDGGNVVVVVMREEDRVQLAARGLDGGDDGRLFRRLRRGSAKRSYPTG